MPYTAPTLAPHRPTTMPRTPIKQLRPPTRVVGTIVLAYRWPIGAAAADTAAPVPGQDSGFGEKRRRTRQSEQLRPTSPPVPRQLASHGGGDTPISAAEADIAASTKTVGLAWRGPGGDAGAGKWTQWHGTTWHSREQRESTHPSILLSHSLLMLKAQIQSYEFRVPNARRL